MFGTTIYLAQRPIPGPLHACLPLSTPLPSRSRRKMAPSASSGPASAAIPALVDAAWLHPRLGTVKLLDATWYMPGRAGKSPAEEYAESRIPGAQFFDLDGVCDRTSNLPHMLPSAHAFAAAADALGISNDDIVVVYDRMGIFSAPRAWWTWHVMGHRDIAVLDGGLPAWLEAKGELERTPIPEAEVHKATAAAQGQGSPSSGSPPCQYKASLRRDQVREMDEMLDATARRHEQIVDARPAARWRGEAPEPRAGLRRGHVPGSINVPFAELLTEEGRILPKEALERVFERAGVDLERPTVATCGSGTTACIIALAAKTLRPESDMAVYDGSWCEWGASETAPVATSTPCRAGA
jgi:thiosulfate/3-mercaptopyruvate sulfurtransferase